MKIINWFRDISRIFLTIDSLSETLLETKKEIDDLENRIIRLESKIDILCRIYEGSGAPSA